MHSLDKEVNSRFLSLCKIYGDEIIVLARINTAVILTRT